jgi:hypothetical protein
MSAIHYAGEIQTLRKHVAPGWAACCSGMRAVRIRAEGRNTKAMNKVTCRVCLHIMSQAGIYEDGIK